MTIQDIINAICDTLYGVFGASYKIYTNQVTQDLQEPCFFIKCISPNQTRELSRRYRKTNQFSIQYLPSDRGVNTTLYTVAESIMDALKGITVQNKTLHATDMDFQINDEVLTVTLNYNLFILENYTPTNMAVLEEVDVGEKG